MELLTAWSDGAGTAGVLNKNDRCAYAYTEGEISKMKMLHVTIRTEKFDDEMEFYREIIGLKIINDMRPMGRNMIFLVDSEGETEIEVIETPGAGNAGNENLSIGFQTENVAAKREELIAKGMDVSPMIQPNPHVQFFFVKDPAGVNIQFM